MGARTTAAAAPAPRQPARPAGFAPPFNGRDPGGRDRAGTADRRVEDGALVAAVVPNGRGRADGGRGARVATGRTARQEDLGMP
jgi:hypothetical protein